MQDNELIERPVTPLMADIKQAICRRYGLNMLDLLSDKRQRHIARPRQIGMYIAKNMTLRSYPEIGRHFGNRDHSTVIHAERTISRMCIDDWEMASDVAELMTHLSKVAKSRRGLSL